MELQMYLLDNLKPLTTEQYDRCRSSALERVRKRIGSRPERKDFERDAGRVWTALDVVALVVFAAALTISSLHIIVHMGQLASRSYGQLQQSQLGTFIGGDLYAAVHQWGAIFLSEGSMILFAVLFGLTRRNSWRRWVYFTLALVAAVFVIVANWQSNVGALESIMPAIFTLGIGLNVERLLVATLKRREDVTARYFAALTAFETASADATKHAEYMPLLRQEIWQRLMALKANQPFVDAPAAFKHQAVSRELARDSWSYEQTLPIGVTPPVSTITPITVTQEAETESFLFVTPAVNGSGKLPGVSVGINNV